MNNAEMFVGKMTWYCTSKIIHTKLHEKTNALKRFSNQPLVLSVIFNNHTAQHRRSLTDRPEDPADIQKPSYNLGRLH